jgi:streptomycin 6-kinase
MFERWDLVPDGEAVITHSSRLLPVLYRGEKAMLKIAVEAEAKRGALLMVWWDGNGAARVLQHEGDRRCSSARLARARSDGARRMRRRGKPHHLRDRRASACAARDAQARAGSFVRVVPRVLAHGRDA